MSNAQERSAADQVDVDVSERNIEAHNNVAEQPHPRRPSNQINIIALLRQPQLFKSTFFELTCQASEALKSQNFQQSARVLQICVQMLEVGKNPLKDISAFWKTCVCGNLACSYQGQWKVKKSHKYCDQMEGQMQRLREKYHTKELSNQSEMKSESQQDQNSDKQLRKNRQIYLKISMQLVKLKFQHCALISQLNEHQKALQKCKSTLKLLEQIIIIILTYTKHVKYFRNKEDHPSSSQPEKEKRGRFEKPVEFAQVVSQYAQTVLTQLKKILNESLENCQKPISEEILRIHQNHFYYWQKNPEKNQQQIKKKFVPTENTSGKRSILGVNKNKHWIDDFNIGGIMHMNELTLSDFENPPPIEQYLFKDKIYELIIFCSVAHFTIATQQRFIDSNRKKQKRNQQKRKEQEKKDKERKLKQQRRQRQRKQMQELQIENQQIKDKRPIEQQDEGRSEDEYPQRSETKKFQRDSQGERQNFQIQKSQQMPFQNNSSIRSEFSSVRSEVSSSQSQIQQEIIKSNSRNSQVLETIQKKYGYEQKSQIFKQSELYHLRAIEIIAKNIQFTIPYLSHLIQSYEKHYIQKKILQPIAAIIEESALSIDVTARQNSVNASGLALRGKIAVPNINMANSFQNYGNNNESQYRSQEKIHSSHSSHGFQKHNFASVKSFEEKHQQVDQNHQQNPFQGIKKMPIKIPSQDDVQQIEIYYQTNQQVNGLKPKNLHLENHRMMMKNLKQIKKNIGAKKRNPQGYLQAQGNLNKVKSERKIIVFKEMQKMKQNTNIYTKKIVKEVKQSQKVDKSRKKSVEKTRKKKHHSNTAQYSPRNSHNFKNKGKDSNHQPYTIFSRQKSPKEVFMGTFQNPKFYFEERAKSPKSKSMKKSKMVINSLENEIAFQKNEDRDRQKDLKFNHKSHTHIKVVFKKKK